MVQIGGKSLALAFFDHWAHRILFVRGVSKSHRAACLALLHRALAAPILRSGWFQSVYQDGWYLERAWHAELRYGVSIIAEQPLVSIKNVN